MAKIQDHEAWENAAEMYACWDKHAHDEILTLFYWILQAYQAYLREGWEEGPSLEETITDLSYVICNRRTSQDEQARGIKEFTQAFCEQWKRAYGGKPPC